MGIIIGGGNIKNIKLGNQDIKKVMIGDKQVWPEEKNYFEVSDTTSDYEYAMWQTDANTWTKEYTLPFDLTPDSVVTFTWNAPNFRVGMYKETPIWFTNGKNIELIKITSAGSGTVSKALKEFTYWADSFLKTPNMIKYNPQVYRTNNNPTANSTCLGKNFTYTLRIDK